MSSRRSLSAMRLGELGTWLGSNLAPSAVKENSKAWAANYSKTHMEGGTGLPIWHIMGGVFVLGYSLEYPHLKHERLREHH